MKSLDELFAGVKTAAIAGHIRPDGDCVGSCLATYNYITTYYPQIEVQPVSAADTQYFQIYEKCG